MRAFLLLLPALLGADAPNLPAEVARHCEVIPASTGLVHLRCGPERLLVAQLHPVEGSVHREIVNSLLDLVPAPFSRVGIGLQDRDLRRTAVSELRNTGIRNSRRVQLVLTSRDSTGQAVGCVYALVDKRRVDRSEVAWCERMTAALLPPPEVPTMTRLQVEEPDLPDEDVGR